ncbi:MAG TPA: hypothetical protein VK066_19995 [Chloroflexota bacterium]|nr:hypothetical protein [Chloroflexota bacterium]
MPILTTAQGAPIWVNARRVRWAQERVTRRPDGETERTTELIFEWPDDGVCDSVQVRESLADIARIFEREMSEIVTFPAH